jgi:hypothetical protein
MCRRDTARDFSQSWFLVEKLWENAKGTESNPSRQDPLFPRVERAVLAILARGKVVAPVDVLVEMEVLRPADLDAWRKGRVPYLERVIQGNLTRLGRLLRILRMYAHDLKLVPSLTVYVRSGQRPRVRLQFTKTGEPNAIWALLKCNDERVKNFLAECEKGSDICSEEGLANALAFMESQEKATLYLRVGAKIDPVPYRRGRISFLTEPRDRLHRCSPRAGLCRRACGHHAELPSHGPTRHDRPPAQLPRRQWPARRQPTVRGLL